MSGLPRTFGVTLGTVFALATAGCVRIPLKGGDIYIVPTPIPIVVPVGRALAPQPGPGEPDFKAPEQSP